MFEWKSWGVMFLPYIDSNGNEALVNVEDIIRIYKVEPDGYTAIETEGHFLICNEAISEIKNKLKGAG